MEEATTYIPKRDPYEEEIAMVLTKRSRKKIPSYIAMEELNLVPYLDVMVNLIIFLLVTITTVLPLTMLSIFPMKAKSANTPTTEQLETKVNLTIFINHEGFTLAGIGGSLPLVEKKGDQYDYETLQNKVVEIKDNFPNETLVVLSAEPDIPYDTIVKVMDTVRNKADRLLFTDVQFSPGFAKGPAAGPAAAAAAAP